MRFAMWLLTDPPPNPKPRRRPRPRRGRRVAPVLALVAALFLGLAVQARADVIWANSTGSGSDIRRAENDGTGDVRISTASVGRGVAVGGRRVYWTNFNGGHISSADIDGSGSAPFAHGGAGPFGIAVDGAHVYWANEGSDSIARANIDGSGVDQSWITGIADPQGVAVDDGHIYWGAKGTNSIGRANLNGTGVEPHLIWAGAGPGDGNGVRGVAVDAHHIYWANIETNQIWRANLDGSGARSLLGGASSPTGVAVDGRHVYWANTSADRLGRANLDGSGVNQSFITGARFPIGVAVAHGKAVPSASSLAFEQDFPGVSPPQELTVTNRGGDDLYFEPARVVGANADDFQISSNGCSAGWLGAGGWCTIEVRFAPSATGQRTATLELANDSTMGPLRVPLSGGRAPAEPPPAEDPPAQPTPTGLVLPDPSADPVPPSGEFTIAGVRALRGGGARIAVEVPSRGTLGARDERGLIEPVTTAVARGGSASLNVGPSATAKRMLRRGRKVRVQVVVTFTSEGGSPASKVKAVRLAKRGARS